MTQEDILDKIEKNEKKSRIQLLVLVSACLLLGFLTIKYSRESNEKTIVLENRNLELEAEKAKKEKLLQQIKQDSAKLADLYKKIKQDSVNLAITRNNALEDYEALLTNNEDLKKTTSELKNYISKEILSPDPIIYPQTEPKIGTKEKNENKSQKKYQNNKFKELQVEIKNYEAKIQNYQTKALDNKNLYLIYIQETGQNGKNIAVNIRKSLIADGYNAPGIEHIQKSFGSRITYFFDEDKETAGYIYKEVSKLVISLNPSFDVKQLVPRKSNLKANKKQIEVWINI